jgi:hypothetical protein
MAWLVSQIQLQKVIIQNQSSGSDFGRTREAFTVVPTNPAWNKRHHILMLHASVCEREGRICID